MERETQAAKRQRTGEGPSSCSGKSSSSSQNVAQTAITVAGLVKQKLWAEAAERVRFFPEEASPPTDPSPLALACRLGAPLSCVKPILQACPQRLRRVVDSRGTPLHEAIVCENVGPDVIKVLLEADEALCETEPPTATRATLLQDVDGFTPLHVLIRRRFQSNILTDEGLIQMLELLVKSCAKAVVVPDRGEYEEPPIVYALKANTYAPMLGSEDETTARMERRIYEMVACMLEHYPEAACCVMAGYRGKYTAVHSAVFHGRSPHTLELLLQAESRCQPTSKACMLANTQKEMPLHFSTMRGEPPASVALLAKSAPAAVHTRDASGLMPTHWLWVRYVSSLVALEDGGRGSDDTIQLDVPNQARPNTSSYSEFASFEQGNLENDLLVIRRLDPSVDFLRMRHIPLDILGDEDSNRWAARTAELLEGVRDRHARVLARSRTDESGPQQIVWKRQEAVASLFWTKLVSLIEASREVGVHDQPIGEHILVHTAFANACFLPAVIRLVATLYPEEMHIPDERGRLPLHYAASREWHDLDWEPENAGSAARPSQLFEMESLASLRSAMELSHEDAASVADKDGRLPLHYMIDSFIKATNKRASDQSIQVMLDLMATMVQLYPDALHKSDGKTKLCPGLQATAAATEIAKRTNVFTPEVHLSIPFVLLRENPALILQHTNDDP